MGHAHFDHIGDVASLPSASLIVGPGSTVGTALADELDVPVSVLEQRSVKALSRADDEWRVVGSLEGVDYFGDGSLWLLDTPGVSIESERDWMDFI